MWIVIVGALLIGVTLGLLGSGGSIITVPILAYVLQHDEKIAVAESLAIVGGIAVFAVVPYARQGQLSWSCALWFGVAGMLGTYFGSWISESVSGAIQLLTLAAVMLIAAWIMLKRARGTRQSDSSASAPDTSKGKRTDPVEAPDDEGRHRLPLWPPRPNLLWQGATVGAVTGFVGVGGGFMIVPSLVFFAGLTMRRAIGTSLAVIVMNSSIGLIRHSVNLRRNDLSLDWTTVAWFVSIGVLASFLGKLISNRLDQRALRVGFAYFLLLMGLFVFVEKGSSLFRHDGQREDGQREDGQREDEHQHTEQGHTEQGYKEQGYKEQGYKEQGYKAQSPRWADIETRI